MNRLSGLFLRCFVGKLVIGKNAKTFEIFLIKYLRKLMAKIANSLLNYRRKINNLSLSVSRTMLKLSADLSVNF